MLSSCCHLLSSLIGYILTFYLDLYRAGYNEWVGQSSVTCSRTLTEQRGLLTDGCGNQTTDLLLMKPLHHWATALTDLISYSIFFLVLFCRSILSTRLPTMSGAVWDPTRLWSVCQFPRPSPAAFSITSIIWIGRLDNRDICAIKSPLYHRLPATRHDTRPGRVVTMRTVNRTCALPPVPDSAALAPAKVKSPPSFRCRAARRLEMVEVHTLCFHIRSVFLYKSETERKWKLLFNSGVFYFIQHD